MALQILECQAHMANPELWQAVLSDEARNCIGLLRGQLSAAWTAEQEKAAERTKNAPLDPLQVAEFRNELVWSLAENRDCYGQRR
jgi:hypothetical protein